MDQKARIAVLRAILTMNCDMTSASIHDFCHGAGVKGVSVRLALQYFIERGIIDFTMKGKFRIYHIV